VFAALDGQIRLAFLYDEGKGVPENDAEAVKWYRKAAKTAQLQNPTIEDKETRPPPRYNEGTLIEAMQNAWRFVDDEVLRERLKEAKGIGTPATRAEIIGGLKQQGFLTSRGKNIVPTENGLLLFGLLEKADPALVDPGVTAQVECLLDDVVVGKQEMVVAIDAVCDAAQRIIGKLNEGAAAGGPSLLGASVGRNAVECPPTPAMKRFADSIARQMGIKPPRGYTKSGSICREFLNQHAPMKAGGETAGEPGSKPASPAQMLFAEKIAQEKGIVVPDDAKGSTAAMSAWIESNKGTERKKRSSKTAKKSPRSTAQKKRTRRRAGGSSNTCSAKIWIRYATANSVWQQGQRSETWRPLSIGRMVCPAWS